MHNSVPQPLVILKAIEGPNVGRFFSFDDYDVFTIGRSRDCSCVVNDDPTFSRHHLLIEINQTNANLKDLGSLNGTYINGIRYGGRDRNVLPENAPASIPIALRDGDHIKAGSYGFALTINALAVCVECGKEIPASDKKEAEFVNGTYLCIQCRQSDNNSPSKGSSIPSSEVRMNAKQREKAEVSPGSVIDELLREYLNHRSENDLPPDINGYHSMEKIGEGGFGAVYKAVRSSDGKIVAIKTMLQTRQPSARQMLMFEREKCLASQLMHRNIVSVGDSGVWSGIHFIEMEYLHGGSCYDLMVKRGGCIPIEELAPIMLDSLAGLAYAHQAKLIVPTKDGERSVRGLIHRDLKPSNILLTEEDGSVVAKLSDFGLSKAFATAGCTQGSITSSAGTFCGSLQYMAREHIVHYRRLLPMTDVFEIAAAFFHMLTGMPVWPEKKGADICKIILESQPRRLKDHLRGASSCLCDVFDQALDLNIEHRFQNGAEFYSALERAL